MLWLYILIFIVSCVLLYFSGELVIGGLMRIARFLGWREFVVAFFVMAFAASLPNLFVGITSALREIPQLSFGDVAGNNLVALTLAVALAVLFAKNREIPAKSRTVQTTSIFTIVAALLPLLLILDGKLSRIDGILLIAFFIFYLFWLFSKKERFRKIYNTQDIPIIKEFKLFLKDLGKLILGIMLLIISAQGIVTSAQFFTKSFDIPLVLFGVLIIGLGNALPEIYFAVASAKRGETWMILGNLMGAVIVPSTLVLGIVALIHPIEIPDFSSLAIARFFLIISALLFLFFIQTRRKIDKNGALVLLLIYITFVIVEILLR
ncbi:sodium:calcium antiporter [Patescibacteria group bacterium]|nr:sodium:calcium antiporter [Patescibacteria group bacterium]MBU4481244.1 sodium:calcium antiporter [Patescibacteria group bacterium]